jgi:hypothetical protein
MHATKKKIKRREKRKQRFRRSDETLSTTTL